MKFHEVIEEIQASYDAKIIGWVSDKQGLIVKCHDTYYPEIPHQYCQYHFLRNLWNHLMALDSQIYIPLKKTLNNLYIHTGSSTQKVYFENVGQISVREVFKEEDEDLQTMLRIRNKIFDTLRGKWLFETLTEHLTYLREKFEELPPEYRFTKITSRLITSIEDALQNVIERYEEVKILEVFFQQIRKGLGEKRPEDTNREQEINAVFNAVGKLAVQKDAQLNLKECKAFLPSKKRTAVEIMGEWCRLWRSYRRGLFQYYHFPKEVRTNMECERAFSKQKQRLHHRVAKANVAHMLVTRGEALLRLDHCELEELKADIVAQYQEEVVKALRRDLREDISQQTAKWGVQSMTYQRLEICVAKYVFSQDKEEKRGERLI